LGLACGSIAIMWLEPSFGKVAEYIAMRGKVNVLSVEPLHEQAESILVYVVDIVSLFLTLDEFTVETGIQDRRVMAGDFFVDDERLLRFTLSNNESDLLSWVASPISKIMRGIERDGTIIRKGEDIWSGFPVLSRVFERYPRSDSRKLHNGTFFL
jgi:hypothetical protein